MISTEGKLIVVVGATGRQGGQVVRQLVKHGWRIRALTRRPTSKKAVLLRQLGVEVVAANLDDPTSLESTFEKAYGVYNIQVPVAGKMALEIRQGQNVARAAQKIKVQHLVYGSAGPGNAKTGIEAWDAKVEIMQAMKRLGLPLTVLRPTALMD